MKKLCIFLNLGHVGRTGAGGGCRGPTWWWRHAEFPGTFRRGMKRGEGRGTYCSTVKRAAAAQTFKSSDINIQPGCTALDSPIEQEDFCLSASLFHVAAAARNPQIADGITSQRAHARAEGWKARMTWRLRWEYLPVPSATSNARTERC